MCARCITVIISDTSMLEAGEFELLYSKDFHFKNPYGCRQKMY